MDISDLHPASLSFVEPLYEAWQRDPAAVDPAWRARFTRLDGRPTAAPSESLSALQDRVDQLIRAYRVRGHMVAKVDPLGLPRPDWPELDPAFHGLDERHMEMPFSCDTFRDRKALTLREILRRLQNTYCRSIGAQYMHIDDLATRRWLQHRMEGTENRLELSRDEQVRILTRLTDAVMFEEFIQKKFMGAKSFSLEGAESLIPLLTIAIERAARQGVDEIVLGMGHRGRLNVLANIVGKSPRDIFFEFEDRDPSLQLGRGDVKYHLGHSGDWISVDGRRVHLSLCFNPSHLEFVDPVVVGRVRAKQDRHGDGSRIHGMGLLVHGDAAFAGEGVVQETLNLSRLEGYRTGGTLHVIVNNQIGFTTPPEEGRSGPYASDVARLLQIPIFHVNGEDPEAVAQALLVAMDFRAEFQSDVVIDMYCYRRRGHNEGDEPAFTQPVLYRAVEERKSVREGYLEHLLALGGLTREEADRIAAERRETLERELSAARSDAYAFHPPALGGVWDGYRGGAPTAADEVETAVPAERLQHLLEVLTHLPTTFQPHPKVQRNLLAWREMARGQRPLDWAAAEALAFGTLATDGYRVRLSGQDSRRGTFSQRHAVIYDIATGAPYIALQHLAPGQAPVEIWNSPLSEAGVLGFEYGYSLDSPDALVLWEAQFGDFVNAAQVIVDQFIVSAEEKWNHLSGLVLLLPHGFEGMGPEHSSARLERFLAQAAGDNIQVVNLTTPAQYFHCLRRQMLRRWRKPLIVMSPKSLLRHPLAVSPLTEFTSGGFRPVIVEAAPAARRILMCSGKIYYDLREQRKQRGLEEAVGLVRLEQLYPLREEDLREALAPFADDVPVVWVQEEPSNMGAWPVLRLRWGGQVLGHEFDGVTRPAAASPATGSASSHRLEQEQLIDAALHGAGEGV